MSHTIELLHGNRLKTGDVKPTLRAQLFEDGYPLNLKEFGLDVDTDEETIINGTVSLRLRRSDADTNKVDVEMKAVKLNRGIVKYDWTDGDTDKDGTYLLEIVVDNGSQKTTLPSTGYDRMYITESI